MTKADFAYILDNYGQEYLMEKLDWGELDFVPIVDFNKDYYELENLVLKQEIQSFLYPLSLVPFLRNENIQIAALSKRLDVSFYFVNETEIKNMAFLNENFKIYFQSDLVKTYIESLNSNVQLEKVDLDDLSEQNLAIHQGKEWSINNYKKLSQEEFVPLSGDGFMAVICLKEDILTRKLAAKIHSEESGSVSNIERTIQKNFIDNQNFITCFLRYDDQAYLHAIMVFKNNSSNSKAVEYIEYSQSTAHGMVEKLMELAPN